MFVSPQSFYVEALVPVMIFGGRGVWKVVIGRECNRRRCEEK